MDQYLYIPFLGEWTSIYQLIWCSPGVQGFDTLPYIWCIQLVFLLNEALFPDRSWYIPGKISSFQAPKGTKGKGGKAKGKGGTTPPCKGGMGSRFGKYEPLSRPIRITRFSLFHEVHKCWLKRLTPSWYVLDLNSSGDMTGGVCSSKKHSSAGWDVPWMGQIIATSGWSHQNSWLVSRNFPKWTYTLVMSK